MNLNFLNGNNAGNDYMSDFAQAQYYDRINEANGSLYEMHVDDRAMAQTHQSPLGSLRGILRIVLMTLTHN